MIENEPQATGTIPRDLSQRAHRRLIGILGFFLPGLLFLLAGLRPIEELPPWKILTSVSAYYYTGAVGVFVGVLFALSLFLFTYQGYEGDKADGFLGKIGGAAALGVALFPTTAPFCLSEPAWWSPAIRVVHYVSAIVLFTSFILFSIWLFRKSNISNRQDRPPDKQMRDNIYLVCGIVMIICVLWAASSLFTKASIFWPEAFAIMAFAISWLVKGEAYQPVVGVIQLLWSKPSV